MNISKKIFKKIKKKYVPVEIEFISDVFWNSHRIRESQKKHTMRKIQLVLEDTKILKFQCRHFFQNIFEKNGFANVLLSNEKYLFGMFSSFDPYIYYV